MGVAAGVAIYYFGLVMGVWLGRIWRAESCPNTRGILDEKL